jgi:ankyrin repeat protein
LLECNARVDGEKRLDTALLCACRDGHESLVTLLLDHNANVNATDVDGNPALLYTCVNGSEPTVRLLLGTSKPRYLYSLLYVLAAVSF